MNDSRIFEHPQGCSSSDSERRFGKEKIVCKFRSTHLTPEQTEDRVTFCQDVIAMTYADLLTKLLREMSPGVVPMSPKQSDRVLNGLVRHPLGKRN
jgi:hypothetical protein